MPLPDYSPRSDSFGNWYFGGFQMDSQIETGYGAGTLLSPTQSEWNAFLTAAFGATKWAVSSSTYFFTFNNAYESLTGTVSSTNFRFRFGSAGNATDYTNLINTAPTGSSVLIGVHGVSASQMYVSTNLVYAVANNFGMWVAYSPKGATGVVPTTIRSSYMGWAKDPVFPTNTNDRVRNLVAGEGLSSSSFSGSRQFICAGSPSTSSDLRTCWANSTITCSVSTPGANVSDLCFLDSGTSYLNIGSAHNAVFVPGTGLTLGQIYRIPPAQDPDGNTEQNIWLCAGQVYGWNGSAGVANAGYKLIRVWSNNIT